MKIKFIDKKYYKLLTEIREYFNLSNKSIHKARNEIKIIVFEKEELVIKSFKVPHFINKLVYSFIKDSKAKKSYENSSKIIEFTPKPIGYIEFKKFGLISDSYFISENFNYDLTIREPLLEKNYQGKELIFKSFAKFTFELHEKNIYHLDYSPGNILIKKQDNDFIFKIVDINRMEFKNLSLDERLKNFAKLWAKDEDLEIIIKEYSKLIKEDEVKCLEIALKYSQLHKDVKNRRKRLKGKKVVD